MLRPKIIIRSATEDDAQILTNLGAQTYRETYEGHIHEEDIEPRIEYKYGVCQQKTELLEDGSHHLLAIANDKPCGFVRLQSLGHTQVGMKRPIKIDRIYILKGFQGMGIGKKLMNACFEIASESRATHLWLGALETNEFAMGFYEKFEFKKFGEEPFIIGQNTYKYLLMVKDL